MKYLIVLCFSLFAIAPLGGCGKSAPPASLAESGARTPQGLLDKLAAIAASEASSNLIALLPLFHPDERPALALVVIVIPLAFAPVIVGLAGKKQVELEPLLKEAEQTLARHGLEDAVESLKKMDIKVDSPVAERLAALSSVMKDVDYMAVARESFAILEKLVAVLPEASGLSSGGFGPITPDTIAKARASLKVDGNTAVVDAIAEDGKPVVMVKAADGYWYVSAVKSKMFDK